MSSLLLLGAGGPFGGGGSNLWTPADEPSLMGWWDLTDYNSYNGTVWTPRFGSGTMTKDTTGPTKTTTGVDGATNALIFTGSSNTQLLYTNPGVNEFVVATVIDFSAKVDNAVFIERSIHTTTRQIYFNTGGFRAEYCGGAIDDYASDVMSPSIVITRHAKNSRLGRYNGTHVMSGVTATSGTEGINNTIRIGAFTIAQSWTCSISAIGFFTSAGWSTLVGEKIEGYLAHEGTFGVSTSLLPGGHVYKVNPPEV